MSDKNLELFLLPINEKLFEKTLTKEEWEWIQTEAKNVIDKFEEMYAKTMDEKVWNETITGAWYHLHEIVRGKIPFGFTLKDE